MIANSIEFRKGYWYLNASLHCNTENYRRIGAGTEYDWEHLESDGTWKPEILSRYCEDMLQAYILDN